MTALTAMPAAIFSLNIIQFCSAILKGFAPVWHWYFCHARLPFLACFKIVSPEDILLNGVQVEADYGFNDEGDGEELAEGQEAEQQVAGEVQAHDSESQDRGGKALGRAADASADQEWPGFSADAPAAEAKPDEELPASSAPHVQHAHQQQY